MKKILFVCNARSTFIEDDLAILRKHFVCKVVQFRTDSNPVKILAMNLMPAVRLCVATFRTDLIFVWFISYQAFLAVLLGRVYKKKVVVVPSGYGVANEPAVAYGLMRNRYCAWMVRFVLRYADLLLPVSRSNMQQIVQADARHCRAEIIAHGVDMVGRESVRYQKERIAACVGYISRNSRLVKGHEEFVRCAALLPGVDFILMGGARHVEELHYLRSIAPPNCKVVEPDSRQDVLNLFKRAAVYLQPSRHESFGLAVLEAMSYGCVPVVSNRRALPEVVGDTGILVDPEDLDSVAQGVRQALQETYRGEQAQRRAASEFTMKRREDELIRAITAVL